MLSEFSQHEFLNVNNYFEKGGEGVESEIDGSLIKIGSAKFVESSNSNELNYETTVYVSINNEVFGYFSLTNKYREGFEKVFNDLKSKGYELHLISGDNIKEKNKLEPFFKENLHFNQSPIDKLNYISNLRKANKNILMVGDGLNDAGALKTANVGITIADDIYHFSPACDGILEATNFKYLTRFIVNNKTTVGIVKISFVLSFFYNLIGLYFAVQGLLSPIIAAILMPASSISVVAFVTFCTSMVVGKNFRKSL